MSADPQQPGTWPVFAALLPHARAVLGLTSHGMGQIAEYLGCYLAARDLFQLIADARDEDDTYGPEHPDTPATRGDLAYWAGSAGMRPGPATSTPRCCPSASGSEGAGTKIFVDRCSGGIISAWVACRRFRPRSLTEAPS